MIELLMSVVVAAVFALAGYMFGYTRGHKEGTKVSQPHAKLAEEALTRAETAMKELQTRREEYEIATIAARQVYVNYMTQEGEPKQEGEPPRLQ